MMAHLSPRTKSQVQQVAFCRKASDRSKRMVIAELTKPKADLPPAKRKTPLKGSLNTAANNLCPAPVPTAPRAIKRTRAEDHVYDSYAAPEVRRSVVKRNDVVPMGLAVAAPEVEPTLTARNGVAASEFVRELHQRTSPVKEIFPKSPKPSPARLASVIERPTAASDEERSLPYGMVANGYHHLEAAERDVQTQHCSDYPVDVGAYRMVDNSETSANGRSSPQPTEKMQDYSPSPHANGFENLLRRVGSPEVVCSSSAGPIAYENGHAEANGHAKANGLANGHAEANSHSQALIPRPAVQSVLKRPASPEYVLPPDHFRGLYNLGNTCYMNTIIQLLYNLECFTCDISPAEELCQLAIRSDGIFLALRQVFQCMVQSGKHAILNPACLQQACEKYMTDFDGGYQQDAQEYLLYILDQIEEEIALCQRQMWEESRIVPSDREKICPTTRNFSCQVRNVLSCEGCDNIVNLEQSARHFSLPLPEDRRDSEAEVPDIETLLNIYFQVETLSRKCEKCGAVTMTSQTKIVKLPRVLILHINRFEIDRHGLCSKVSVPVKFAETLDLGNWCVDKVRGPCELRRFADNGTDDLNGDLPGLQDCRGTSYSNGDTRTAPEEVRNSRKEIEMMDGSKENGLGFAASTAYNLHGIVSHVGNLASCGHYTVDIYDRDNLKYVRCDDALVREVTSDDVFCEEKFTEAYVLLYVLQDSGCQWSRN